MRLADFIRDHHEAIVSEWESFARTLTPAADGLSKAGLRDHAEEILTAVVIDMESRQSAAEKADKSKGQKAEGNKHEETIGKLSQLHAVLRIDKGFTLAQVVSEYRALRASVFRLWGGTSSDPEGALRFNETIDEALTEAVNRYAQRMSQYRDQLIGLVSHDLRNPLGGILTGAQALTRVQKLDDRSARIASNIESSAKRMVRIVDDLLDLTRTRLGAEIVIVRAPADVGVVCEMVIAEIEGKHPAAVRYTAQGDLRGEWDGDRLAQVLSNLIGNALQHGDANTLVTVAANDEGQEVVVAVHNEGRPIPESALKDIFEPMVRRLQDPTKASTGLGLGLYIAKELVTAHGGKLDVSSSDADGTTFRMRLPRRAA